MAAVCGFALPYLVNQRYHRFVEVADVMSKITSISAPKVGMDVRFFASYSAMLGLITRTCSKFLAWMDYLPCCLEMWHFSLVCFTCNFVHWYSSFQTKQHRKQQPEQ